MYHLDGKVGRKYNHHDVQDELLNVNGSTAIHTTVHY